MSSRPKQSSSWTKKQKKKKPPTNNGLQTNGLQQQNFPPAHQAAAQPKLQTIAAANNKHIKHYESSSDEDQLESDTVIGSILKGYIQTGGRDEYLGRTRNFLDDAFFSDAAICLICISRVKRDNAIWSCIECYCIFHLQCIQRWSKDSVVHQKHILVDTVQTKRKVFWGCPKCRHEYEPDYIPDRYECFCKKSLNPKFQPLLMPHSCGEICRKNLKPFCGHQCLLLCHPGPCPPCPITVTTKCYCGIQAPQTRRCSQKEWSCGNRCGKLLACGKHKCADPCHDGDCQSCGKKSLQKCMCKNSFQLRDCAQPFWQCDKVCDKPLGCGNHKCSEICHAAGDCKPCPLTELRTCPCGKNKYQLPCTEDTPTCRDTCGKILECGEHNCHQRCHKGKCGQCLETVTKQCRCGQHTKDVQCSKPYMCETKCKNMKDCNKHPCNRKCCDGNCAACEKPCARTLNCGSHKCTSVCHRGPCYPCDQNEILTCRCTQTKITVSCGRKSKTRPPKCSRLCLIPPDCHHDKRQNHKCHFGDCPPCRQICNKTRADCTHPCPSPCHSAVLVKIQGQTGSMPWEQTGPQLEIKSLPCPNCIVPISVTCLGEHETSDWPCYLAKPSSCNRFCGRTLLCGHHICSFPCHLVEGASDESTAGINCEVCENGCTQKRPEGCHHICPNACHPGRCPPCKQLIRIRCYCGLNQPYVACSDWLNLAKRNELQSCGNQCPKNYICGHRCRSNCHPGDCPNGDSCKKKVKITCDCKRLKKDVSCGLMRNGQHQRIDCDAICVQKKAEEKKLRDAFDEQKRLEEEEINQRELAKYQKIFEGKKKNRDRRIHKDNDDDSFFGKYKFVLFGLVFGPVIAFICYFVFGY